MSGRKAVLDIGNSAIKLGLVDVDKNDLDTVFECDSIADYREKIGDFNIELLLYSNVRPGVDESLLTIDDATRLINADHCSYDSIVQFNESLDIGIDRKLACIAAAESTEQPFIVVTLGTATTISLVLDHQCDYSIIWPGLQLSAKAISDNTRIDVGSDFTNVFQETLFTAPGNLENCVKHGIYYSTVLAIESWISEYESHSGKSLDVLLTGGNANAISNQLNRFHTVESNLVLRGLLEVLGKVLFSEQ